MPVATLDVAQWVLPKVKTFDQKLIKVVRSEDVHHHVKNYVDGSVKTTDFIKQVSNGVDFSFNLVVVRIHLNHNMVLDLTWKCLHEEHGTSLQVVHFLLFRWIEVKTVFGGDLAHFYCVRVNGWLDIVERNPFEHKLFLKKVSVKLVSQKVLSIMNQNQVVARHKLFDLIIWFTSNPCAAIASSEPQVKPLWVTRIEVSV